MASSQNGWTVLSPDETRRWALPGTGRHLILAPGSAGFVLAHLALWVHEEVEPLGVGTWDDWGYAVRPVRGQTTGYSNHASGTAMDLNAQLHPLGRRNTWSEDQAHKIRDRLAKRYRGTIRWGGDYVHRADEMHFEVNSSAPRILALAHLLDDSDRGRRVRVANG